VEKINIIDYKPEHQEGIEEMMTGIAKEFTIPITSPQSTRINEVYHLPDQKFWVALHENKIAGTIGLSLFSNNNAVLKRMMVDKNYRGKKYNTATLLLNTSMTWAKERGIKQIYLGTMEQFKAAQNFYTKQGFVKIKKEELPFDYSPNPIDSLFYKINVDGV
jgi:N-acetylglutamate synthase-like GNAT family acetyltransferase